MSNRLRYFGKLFLAYVVGKAALYTAVLAPQPFRLIAGIISAAAGAYMIVLCAHQLRAIYLESTRQERAS